MTLSTKVKSTAVPRHLRPYNPFRDSEAVADLIEANFASTLDPDGRRYLNQLRAGSRQRGFYRWIKYIYRSNSYPLSGYVWEEDGKVVGNLSLVPFHYRGQRINMIANVAVSPQYRRRGIARALTQEALEKSRKGRAAATWLQVRHDNLAAINLYIDMGFVTKASRTTWIAYPDKLVKEVSSDARVRARKRSYWQQQKLWLEQNYPVALRWYFLLCMTAMAPGILSTVYQFFNDLDIQHWAVVRNNRLLGVFSWQRSFRYADYLWLASPPEHEEDILQAILPSIRSLRWMNRPLALDYPKDRAVNALKSVGFQPKITLNWMEVTHERRET